MISCALHFETLQFTNSFHFTTLSRRAFSAITYSNRLSVTWMRFTGHLGSSGALLPERGTRCSERRAARRRASAGGPAARINRRWSHRWHRSHHLHHLKCIRTNTKHAEAAGRLCQNKAGPAGKFEWHSVLSDLAPTVWHHKKTIKVYWSAIQRSATRRKIGTTEQKKWKVAKQNTGLCSYKRVIESKTTTTTTKSYNQMSIKWLHQPSCPAASEPHLRQWRVQYWVNCIENAKTTRNVFRC